MDNITEDNIIRIETEKIILLINILDSFNDFSKKLTYFFKESYDFNKANSLYKASIEKDFFAYKKYRDFYEENKDVIDEINKFNRLIPYIYSDFIFSEKYNKRQFYKMYDYIQKNKKDIYKIKDNAKRLIELGFNEIILCEDYNIKDKIYTIPTKEKLELSRFNTKVMFVENIDIIPNYHRNVINYKTEYSNYEISTFFKEYSNKIILNNLIFDSSRLPKSITKEELYDVIVELADKYKDKNEYFRDTISMQLQTSKLSNELLSTERIYDSLKSIKDKKEIRELLQEIRNKINELESFNSNYMDEIIDGEYITEEKIEESKVKIKNELEAIKTSI